MYNEIDSGNTESLGKNRKIKRIFNPKWGGSTSGLKKASKKNKKSPKKTIVK